MIRQIEFHPAFHKVHKDPSKEYEVHGVEIHFILKGKKGVLVFRLFTDWMLPETVEWWKSRGVDARSRVGSMPMSAGMVYHSSVPIYPGHKRTSGCQYLGSCYAESITMEEPRNILVSEGSDALWKWMEQHYKGMWG